MQLPGKESIENAGRGEQAIVHLARKGESGIRFTINLLWVLLIYFFANYLSPP
jgi:hypothetical protein